MPGINDPQRPRLEPEYQGRRTGERPPGGWQRVLRSRPPRGFGVLLLIGFYGATGYYGAQLGGQWPVIVAQYGAPSDVAANLAGFSIQTVQISGQESLTDDEILGAAGVNGTASLPLLDAAASRQRLESLPMVQSASVRKLYPGTLAVTLEERRPYAVWQQAGAFQVISRDGTPIATYEAERYPALPIVVGEGANTHAQEIVSLLAGVPALQARVKAAVRVADRRWNLSLDHGVIVRLPESEAKSALERLVALEDSDKLLERDLLAVDLRIPDRVVVRLSDDAAAARAAMLAKKAPKKGAET